MRGCEFPRCAAPAVRGAYCPRHWVRLGLAADQARRSAHYRTPTWLNLKALVLREQPLCAVCGHRARAVDHIVERRDGGTDARANLQGLCWPCHSAKTARRTRRGRGEM